MIDAPSPWVVRWADYLTRSPVLDVACGSGRHARYFAARGLQVVAVDRDPQAIEGVEFVQADLEQGAWPLGERRFAAIVVTNYLHRPLFPALEAALEEGGVLIYETFMTGNERYGRPSNPAFLLRPGELLQAFGRLHVVAFEQGIVAHQKTAVVQRLFALRGQGESVRIAP
ncbi:MAG TPA: class I SAM-dependent methyltransferase [Burkholderiales bacterium]|nr:class I SAM-dependent methyltransferase [Burkholderiales bacterium]